MGTGTALAARVAAEARRHSRELGAYTITCSPRPTPSLASAPATRLRRAKSSRQVSRRSSSIWATASGFDCAWSETKSNRLLRREEVAGDHAAGFREELRLLGGAARHRVGTARVEVAAGGRVQRTRHLTGQNNLVVASLVRVRRQRRREERLGVRVLRRFRDDVGVADL